MQFDPTWIIAVCAAIGLLFTAIGLLFERYKEDKKNKNMRLNHIQRRIDGFYEPFINCAKEISGSIILYAGHDSKHIYHNTDLIGNNANLAEPGTYKLFREYSEMLAGATISNITHLTSDDFEGLIISHRDMDLEYFKKQSHELLESVENDHAMLTKEIERLSKRKY